MAEKNLNIVVKHETLASFRKRAVYQARALDRGERIAPAITISFEDPLEMTRFLTERKLTLLRTVREHPGPVSSIARRLRRDRSAVARDIEQLEGLGLVTTILESNPGHGRHRMVAARAGTFRLIAEI